MGSPPSRPRKSRSGPDAQRSGSEPQRDRERGAISSAVHAAAGKVGDLAEGIESVGDAVSSKARPVLADVVHDVGEAAQGARRRVRARTQTRRATKASRARLPHLYEVHPEARRAAPRERGLRVVPIEEIAGTTVSSVPRGKDFLPIGSARTLGWRGRWQRILKGVDALVALPPVDLLRYGDRYWVVDGHNRIAAARRVGQVGVDANVTDLVGPGPADPAAPIAAYLGDSTDLRAVGSGRRLHRHVERAGGGEHADGGEHS